MKKLNKREHINLFFSAFLILAFIICANFFANFSATMSATVGQLIMIAVYVVFGLLLFYATRVGDGKAVFRFSVLTLLVLVLPAALILVFSLARFMPFHSFFAADSTGHLSVITTLAAIALGYGIPYTFVSGFETAVEEEEAEAEAAGEETEMLNSLGVDLSDTDEEEAAEASGDDAAAAEEAEEAADEAADKEE